MKKYIVYISILSILNPCLAMKKRSLSLPFFNCSGLSKNQKNDQINQRNALMQYKLSKNKVKEEKLNNKEESLNTIEDKNKEKEILENQTTNIKIKDEIANIVEALETMVNTNVENEEDDDEEEILSLHKKKEIIDNNRSNNIQIVTKENKRKSIAILNNILNNKSNDTNNIEDIVEVEKKIGSSNNKRSPKNKSLGTNKTLFRCTNSHNGFEGKTSKYVLEPSENILKEIENEEEKNEVQSYLEANANRYIKIIQIKKSDTTELIIEKTYKKGIPSTETLHLKFKEKKENIDGKIIITKEILEKKCYFRDNSFADNKEVDENTMNLDLKIFLIGTKQPNMLDYEKLNN